MVGYIKIYRKLQSWEWYKKSEMVHLFIHLLISANNADKPWQNMIIKRGQVVTGLNSLSEKTGISVRTIRTCLERLKSTNELSVKSTNKFSIITICKYDDYNNSKSENDKQIDKQLVTPPTTTKNNKKKELIDSSIMVDFSSKKSQPQTIEERISAFRETLIPYAKSNKNPTGKYAASMVKDFFEYWTEPTTKGNKFRRELEVTWSLPRRLSTWDTNDFGSNKKNTQNEVGYSPQEIN